MRDEPFLRGEGEPDIDHLYLQTALLTPDAAPMIVEIVRDSTPVPRAIVNFLDASMPVINTVLPHYIDKRGEFSIRCETPRDMLEYFKRWAILQVEDMRFDMPGAWKFGSF